MWSFWPMKWKGKLLRVLKKLSKREPICLSITFILLFPPQNAKCRESNQWIWSESHESKCCPTGYQMESWVVLCHWWHPRVTNTGCELPISVHLVPFFFFFRSFGNLIYSTECLWFEYPVRWGKNTFLPHRSANYDF